MKKLKETKNGDRGFVIVFTLILLSIMMVVSFAFVLQTALDRKTSKAYSAVGKKDEFVKGLVSNVTHNIKFNLEKNDPGTAAPVDSDDDKYMDDEGTEPVRNAENHSMFHRLQTHTKNRAYLDIRTSFLTWYGKTTWGDGDGNGHGGDEISTTLEFYLGESGGSIIAQPAGNQGYTDTSNSGNNVRTVFYDGVDYDDDGNYDCRYTYMVMSQTGKIDPNFATSATATIDENDLTTKFDERLDGTEVDFTIAPNYCELVLGTSPTDDTVDLPQFSIFDATVATEIAPSTNNGLMPSVGWTSFPHLSETLGLPAVGGDASDLRDADTNKEYYSFYPHSVEETLPALNLSQRYDLALIQDNTAPADKFKLPGGGVTFSQAEFYMNLGPTTDPDGDGNAGTLLDAIYEAGIQEGVTTAGLGCRTRKQLAANILDYCDTDLAVTTTMGPQVNFQNNPARYNASPATQADAYAGYEPAPALNEVLLRLIVYKEDANSDGVYEYSVNRTTAAYIELFFPEHIWQDPANKPARFINSGQNSGASAFLGWNYNETQGHYFFMNGSYSYNDPDGAGGSENIKYVSGNKLVVYKSHSASLSGDSLNNFQLHSVVAAGRGKNLGLKTDGTPTSGAYFSDIAYIVTKDEPLPETGIDIEAEFSTLGITTGTLLIDFLFECKDPYNNTHRANWELHDYMIVPSGAPSFPDMSEAAENVNLIKTSAAISAANADADKEYAYTQDMPAVDYYDTRQLSTGYFRNGPPKSLVELGSIATGNSFQTLDLLAEPNSSFEGHYALLNKLALGDGKGLQTGTTLAEIKGRRINPNTRFPSVLKSVFYGYPKVAVDYSGTYSDPNAPEFKPSVARDFIANAKIDHLVDQFPGIKTPNDDSDDFSGYDDTTGMTLAECRSIYGRKDATSTDAPDRNPIAYRKPFRDARGTAANELNDHEAERLFWLSKDLMGGVSYFSIIMSLQTGTGNDESPTRSRYFTPDSDFSVYRAEVSYGLDPEDTTRTNKKMRIHSIRKTK